MIHAAIPNGKQHRMLKISYVRISTPRSGSTLVVFDWGGEDDGGGVELEGARNTINSE